MRVEIKEIAIQTNQGHQLGAVKFSSEQQTDNIVVISSATGVLQKYYSKYAQFFASQGFTVYTFDYHGIGSSGSQPGALKTNVSSLRSWGSEDQAAVIEFAKNENPNAKLTLITHSLGGQLLGFNPNYAMIDQAILVASQSGYWKYFKGFHRAKMWLFWFVLIPCLTPFFGYFPAKKLGLFENLPKRAVYEWASWGKRKEYLMHFRNDQDYFFDKIEIPLLVLSFSKDTFAPKTTVDWLAKQFTNADLERVHHTPKKGEAHVKHFGYFKSIFKEQFWQQSMNWILKKEYQ